MNEIWVDITGTNGRYSVSNLGNVRSNWAEIPQRNLPHRMRIEKQKILKIWVHTTGYYRVSLGRNACKYVHRLVAAAFVANPNNLPQVDHIDGDRLNNAVENLQWVSAKQNAQNGGARHGWAAQIAANVKRKIHEFRKQEYQALLDKGYSLRQIAKAFGTSHSSIRRGLDG